LPDRRLEKRMDDVTEAPVDELEVADRPEDEYDSDLGDAAPGDGPVVN
jgi:hypothetical protein